jgi:hypothetical protein
MAKTPSPMALMFARLCASGQDSPEEFSRRRDLHYRRAEKEALAAKAEARHEQEAKRAARARTMLPKKSPVPRAIKSWIEQRARQRDDEGHRFGARRIWEELRRSFAENEWVGVAETAPTYDETCAIVKRVRGKKTT